ncbi:diguanylate cyclase domain-containing protein [Marinospirillum alkaliphilum]|uniref:PAS domain S-box-containing protein/diguanylate cyclase (GGDEF) domain-containing protein n=1 Tax=Marinospirillum alkaliphilum DSM 21637 TaxID=1122209 RepID=A0A1K1U4W0_9GAMM|nr:diguanylate cyclase [Marinospirillum alkaliphilum]SFX07660.1 PAS domain S-box-containing protein/diguanylate cyclase (GGDEF) domain-containing protein [Marinospirillum alkaliphilum DSM 21637]
MTLQQRDYKQLIDLLETGLIVLDSELKVLLWNPWIARISGISEAEARGCSLNTLFKGVIDPTLLDALTQATSNRLSRRLSHQLHPHLLPLYQRQSNQHLHHSILVQPVTHDGHQACLVQITDVTSTVRREQHLRAAMDQVRHLAHHDVLTGLGNRSLLNDRLQAACRQARQHNEPFALFFIDLDGFKSVNDVYGHDAGDALLQELAQRLANRLQAGDTAARLGGDELIALTPSITDPEAAVSFAETLCSLLAEPFTWQQIQLQVGASIGVALWPEQGETPDALLTSADNAMYLAKSLGKGQAAQAAPVKNTSATTKS